MRDAGQPRIPRATGTSLPAGNGEEGLTMGVKSVGEKYRCNLCGNEVEVTKAGGGQLVCCGQPMEKTG